MFIGDKKKPIAIMKKRKLLTYLDEEFYILLDDAYNHISGFKKISFDDLTLSEAYLYATRYLVLKLMQENCIGRL